MKEIKDILRKLEPVMRDRVRGLWYWSLLPKDEKAFQKNKDLLRLIADKKAKLDFREEIRLPPPNPSKLAGEYDIGTVI